MRSSLAALAASIAVLAASSPPQAADATTAPAAAARTAIQISFKLDPRLSGPTYGGERWISPRIFSGAAAQNTVDARAFAVTPTGRSTRIAVEWSASNPDLVTVSPPRGEQVQIVAKRAGESTVTVTSSDASKKLTVKVEERNGVMQVRIVQ